MSIVSNYEDVIYFWADFPFDSISFFILSMSNRDSIFLSRFQNPYYICSIGADAEEFERTARGHWGVENSLHWQIDFTFGDDKNTSMAKTCAKI